MPVLPRVLVTDDYVEKRLSPRERTEPEAVARLRSEARLLERLHGLALGITPRLLASGDDAQGPWHRLERVRLPTVADRLEAAGGAPLDAIWIERAARSCVAAIAKLHEASDERGALAVVHADLSPANLAVDDDGGGAVVLDFDLACWREGPPRDGAFRGTIAYAAPEIARGERPTPKSDLFSIGAVLLHCMTGRAPRSGPSMAALLFAAAEHELLRPEHACFAARGRGHAAALACLAHDPALRPGSAHAILSGWPPTGAGPLC